MKAHLTDSPLFSHLDASMMLSLQGMSSAIQIENNQSLFEAGQSADHFFFIQTGQIKLTLLSMQGEEKVVELLTSGATFAEALMFQGQARYPVNATAIGHTELISINNSDFLNLLRGSVETCFKMMADMSLRLRHMVKEIDEISLQSASGRVAGYLCAKSLLEGAPQLSFELNTPKRILASRLSVKPETLSRILTRFSNQGLVRIQGGTVEILNERGLRNHAEQSGICTPALIKGCRSEHN